MTTDRPMASVLALDIGNVCIAIDPLPLLNEIGFTDLDDFHTFDADGSVWQGIMDFEEGRRTVAEFREWLSTVFPTKLSVSDVDRVWGLLLKDEIPGMAEIVDQAKNAGLQVVFFSDICPIRYAMVKAQLSFIARVDGAVLSFEVGCHKPEVGMYEGMERNFCDGRAPMLYADDVEANVDAARARGWRAHLFANAKDLAAELTSCLEDLA